MPMKYKFPADRDPSLYKTKVLMSGGSPQVAEDMLPKPRFPEEVTKEAGLFSAFGKFKSTALTDYDTRKGHMRNRNRSRDRARVLQRLADARQDQA